MQVEKILKEVNPSEIIKNKANELYKNVCQELIESNGLKDRAVDICNRVCDKLIADEKAKDPLTSFERTIKDVKREVGNI